MKKLVIATAAILGLGIAIPAHAASEIDCMVMWDKADVNKNGTLEGKDATAYLDAIRPARNPASAARVAISVAANRVIVADLLYGALRGLRTARDRWRSACNHTGAEREVRHHRPMS